MRGLAYPIIQQAPNCKRMVYLLNKSFAGGDVLMFALLPTTPYFPRVVPFILPPELPAAVWLTIASVAFKIVLIAVLIVMLIIFKGGK